MARIAVAGATGRVGRHIVEVLEGDGHEVVAMSRAQGVDVIPRNGLAAALDCVESVVDAATGPSAEQDAATEFFTTAARNLQEAGWRAGVRQMVVVSIIGTGKDTASARPATRPTQTTRTTPAAPCCRARMRPWPARPPPNGWRPRVVRGGSGR